jgi:hypothetical protein
VIEAIAFDDASRAYATLVSAFVDDPVERWMYPELDDYEAHFPMFLAALGGAAFEAGTAWHLSFFAVVGLWLPPGAEPDADLVVTVCATRSSPLNTEMSSPCSRRWIHGTLTTTTGTSPGSVSTLPYRGEGWVAAC